MYSWDSVSSCYLLVPGGDSTVLTATAALVGRKERHSHHIYFSPRSDSYMSLCFVSSIMGERREANFGIDFPEPLFSHL